MSIYLLPTEVVADDMWNSRTRPDPGLPELSDEELATSIREVGLLQPLRVRKFNGVWHLVFGFRRLRACLKVNPGKKVPCTVMETTGDFAEDDLCARLENMGENSSRKDLKPYDLADAIFRLKQFHPSMTFRQIGERVGKTEEHMERLCRLRAKLCPDLLEAWRLNSDRFTIADLLAVLTAEDQVAAYNGRMADRRGGRPKGSKTSHAVNVRDIGRWKKMVEEARDEATHPRDISLLKGVKRALDAVERGVFDMKEILR